MQVSKEEFFRQITLRICGSLQIEQALRKTFDYLREYFPVDKLFLEVFDTSLGAVRRIAHESAVKGDAPEEIVPLSEELLDWVRRKRDPFLVTVGDPNGFIQAARPIVKVQDGCDAVLPLHIDNKVLGLLVLRKQGSKSFDSVLLELLSTIQEPVAMALSNALSHEALERRKDALLDDNRFLRDELVSTSHQEVVGVASAGIREVMKMVRQVASRSNTVLLLGETGVGKEIFANEIHALSPRRDGPFIKVNCGAIPDSLLDSELFGHEKGAFTGATVEKRGRFERAHGGTIFLDEIGELPLAAQVRLLRVLQNREIERVGGVKPIPIDIRVIAATHRNLEAMVAAGQFRDDLWFRLNVFPIHVPPLRERADDIPLLVRHFVNVKSKEFGFGSPPSVAPGALRRLMTYEWPGNVRELQNVVERELIRHSGGHLTFDAIIPAGGKETTLRDEEFRGSDEVLPLDQAMAQYIAKVLRLTGGKVHGPGGAAELLRINPSTLRTRMEKLGFRKSPDRGARGGDSPSQRRE